MNKIHNIKLEQFPVIYNPFWNKYTVIKLTFVFNL